MNPVMQQFRPHAVDEADARRLLLAAEAASAE